jgi:hypothetical protein
MALKLSEFAESMDIQNDEMVCYANRETGVIETVLNELLRAIEDEEDPEEAVDLYGGGEEDIATAREILKSDKWIALPSKFDINDYTIMQDFCRLQQDSGLKAQLENTLRGNGAFRRFREAVERNGLLEKWYAFKSSVYLEIAKDWCEKNGVKWED